MDNTIVAKVSANIEIDIDKLISTVAKEYDEPISEVTMDDIYEFMNNSLDFLRPRRNFGHNCIQEIADGPSINGFEDNSYEKIANRLEELQNNEH